MITTEKYNHCYQAWVTRNRDFWVRENEKVSEKVQVCSLIAQEECFEPKIGVENLMTLSL